jgi:hypothetical protein
VNPEPSISGAVPDSPSEPRWPAVVAVLAAMALYVSLHE